MTGAPRLAVCTLTAVLGCAPQHPAPEVHFLSDGHYIQIAADRAFSKAILYSPEGAPLEVRPLPAPVSTLSLPLNGSPVSGSVTLTFSDRSATLPFSVVATAPPAPRPPAPGQLAIEELVFPADRDGFGQAGVVDGALTLGPGWWSDLVKAAPGIGFRPSDPEVPRSHHGVVVRNRGDQPADVVVQLAIVDDLGAPDPVWAPRTRGAATSHVQALVRVPSRATARVALPVWLDERQITEDARLSWRVVSLNAPGVSGTLASERRPLAARRAGSVSGLLTALAMAVGCVGVVGVLVAGARSLPRWSTADQIQISMFAALLFLVGLAGQAFGVVFAALMGPFSIFVTAILDDALRAMVLLALLLVVRRRGAVALTLGVAWLMRSALFGGFTLLDGLHAGGQIFWLELALGVAGTWGKTMDQTVRFVPFVLALTTASVLSTAGALAMQTTLLRLWLDPWFVAAWLAGPAGLYVMMGCAIAWRPARALRAIA